MEMPRGVFLARLFKTDVYATGSFLLLMVLLMILNGEQASSVAVWEFALIVSVLVHEFGHVYAVRKFTGGTSVVLLWGLGGLCIHEPTPVIRKRIGIALMGPAFGFVLGGISWAVAAYAMPDQVPPPVAVFMNAMIVLNIVYTAFNLLPILPLDGGQATLAALESRLGPGKALRATRLVSVITAGACLGVALVYFPGNFFLILIIGFLGLQNLVASRHGL